MIRRILVADDDTLSRDFLLEAVRSAGFEATPAVDGAAAIALLEVESFDAVITDLRMPGADGLAVLAASQARQPDRPVIVLTAYGAVETAVDAMRQGAADFLLKPVSPDALDLVLKRVQQTAALKRENRVLRAAVETTALENGGTIVGRSPALREAVLMAERVARTAATVLIRGESGTGKELIAALIHRNSTRAVGPFVRVNCAALTDTLLASELFGHEKGAFTGAHQKKEGRFDLADGGTLFLDEIGELTPDVQAKLLRVLEQGEFERVGGTTTLKVDVRIVAATNRDLEQAIKAGGFREDLFYRLNVFPVTLPPLRERKGDLPQLAQNFLARYRRELGGTATTFARESLDAMAAHDWPGNVRELINTVQRAVLRATGPVIEPAHLGLAVRAATTRSVSVPIGLTIDETERHLILKTLDLTGWNRTDAARILGVTTRTLSNKLKLWREQGLLVGQSVGAEA